ncbi:MAG: cation:proton antiporter [Caulobacteraceae bacterium]|nr:cation:proton antiporter [Caulobacteraceae bacterium]
MAAEVSAGDYKDVVLFLATAGIVVPLVRRLRISPILGFLVAGVALGPFGLGALADQASWLKSFTVDNPNQIRQLAEFGVVFLLFSIGLELSWERLRLMRRMVFGLGGLQVTICTAAIAGAAMLLGQPLLTAAAVGAALALSSTAIVMPILAAGRRQHSPAGRATFSVLLMQDLAVAPILITLAVLGPRSDEPLRAASLFLAFAPSVIAVVVLVVLGRLLLRPMLRSVAKAKSEELFMAASLLVVIGAGLVSAVAGLSMALGAFIAGLLLAETEYRHEVEVTIEPFKGLLLGLFFVSVGIGLDLSLLAERPALIFGVTAGLMALNAAVIFGLGRLFGLASSAAAETALLLAGGGEFAFVILDHAMQTGVVPRGLAHTILVSSTLSMFCIPMLASLGERLGGRQTRVDPAIFAPEPLAEDSDPRVLIVGYGRVGRLVGEMLDRHDLGWSAADRDPRLVEAGRREGRDVVFGDASRTEFLKRCGLEQALALVVTMDNPDAAEAVVGAARNLRQDLTVVARARDARHAQRLYELGATDVVPETVEARLQLSEAVLVDVGVPMGLVIASIHERRDEYRRALNRPEALSGRTRRFRRAAAQIGGEAGTGSAEPR